MLIIEEIGCGVYENALNYLCKFLYIEKYSKIKYIFFKILLVPIEF